jgi:uncharacterized protein YggU (UPF0235/DUF167 family)
LDLPIWYQAHGMLINKNNPMYIHVKAKTKQKEEYIKELKPNYFEISVKEKAEKNLANKRILEILITHFETPKIKIINGHRSPSKLISVET